MAAALIRNTRNTPIEASNGAHGHRYAQRHRRSSRSWVARRGAQPGLIGRRRTEIWENPSEGGLDERIVEAFPAWRLPICTTKRSKPLECLDLVANFVAQP